MTVTCGDVREASMFNGIETFICKENDIIYPIFESSEIGSVYK